MKIAIPAKIKEELANIASVWVDFDDSRITPPLNNTKSISAPKEHIALYDWLDIFDEYYTNCTSLKYRIVYNDGTEQRIYFNKKTEARYGISGATVKLGIPQRIKDKAARITKASLLVKSATETVEIDIPVSTVESNSYFRIPLIIYTEAQSIAFKILLDNGNSDDVEFTHNKKAIIYKSKESLEASKCLRKNTNTIFSDDNEGRLQCLRQLEERIAKVSSPYVQDAGKKTLLYYAVYFDTGYVDLFNMSLTSVLKNTSHDFDVLIITDKATQKRIEAAECAKLVSLKYLITETPTDGVEASKNKVRIYQYAEIYKYNRILFLDCDVIATKDCTFLFNQHITEGTFYSIKNNNINIQHFQSIYHGFITVSQEFVEEMRCVGQQPFNAGQFLFKNSEEMRQHFENLLWFMDNWPSEYFFEQSFMCYYFAAAYMVDVVFLAKHIGINSTKDTSVIDSDIENKSLVHFIAPPLEAAHKIAYIDNYLKQLDATASVI